VDNRPLPSFLLYYVSLKREIERPSVLRKFSGASLGLSRRCKGSRGYSLSLLTLGPSPNNNEVKKLWLVKRICGFKLTYSSPN